MEAAGHGNSVFESTIGQHPTTAGIVMGVLMLIILILAVMLYGCQTKAAVVTPSTKSSFSSGGYHGFTSHPNLLGGHDAGGMPIGNTAENYYPLLRYGGGGDNARWMREGLVTAPAAPGVMPQPTGVCGAGQVARTYQNPNGALETVCVSKAAAADMSTCSAKWDLAATAEAQALATVGSYQHDMYGERALQSAINAAYDGNAGLTDAELQTLMHAGGTP